MEYADVLKALLAFSLGLLAKFIYDMWREKREQKSLVFVKTTLSSFSLNDLDENIREQMKVQYSYHDIKSIRNVRVEVENTGRAAINNQAFTVQFSDKAYIIGEPQYGGSLEDLRHIEEDTESETPNKRRYIINLLSRKRRVNWDFIVINHDANDFRVDHGTANATVDKEKFDIDVDSTVTTERIQADVPDQIFRIIRLFIYIQIVVVIRRVLDVQYFIPGISTESTLNIVELLTAIVIIWLWFLIIREFGAVIVPLLKRPEQLPTTSITVTDIHDSHGISIGSQGGMGDFTENPINLDAELIANILRDTYDFSFNPIAKTNTDLLEGEATNGETLS